MPNLFFYYYVDKQKGKRQLQDTLKFLKKIGAEDFRKTLKMQYDKRIIREKPNER